MKGLVAGNIRTRRAELGLTQHQLAQRLGVDSQYVSRWERAQVLPSQTNLAALSLALGCDLGDFYEQEAA